MVSHEAQPLRFLSLRPQKRKNLCFTITINMKAKVSVKTFTNKDSIHNSLYLELLNLLIFSA
uniref:Uncharacterized protein n=1 Tax=Arundo donax TaxID=35708 RepID=A0A0A9DHM6_ARUDO